jgi:hypothetical protein
MWNERDQKGRELGYTRFSVWAGWGSKRRILALKSVHVRHNNNVTPELSSIEVTP